jgi:hypothetical protein
MGKPDSRLINSVSVETPYGFRTFNLHHGDICSYRDDLLVVSGHADPGSYPAGAVIDALSNRFGIDFSDLSPLLLLEEAAGAWRVHTGRLPHPGQLLLVRIPGPSSVLRGGGNPIEVYSRLLWTVFGSLAAMELDEQSNHPQTMAMSVLGGARGYPIGKLMEELLRQSLNWLKISRHMHTVNFYVYDVYDDDHAAEWGEAMNALLGRSMVSVAGETVTQGLREELLSRIEACKAVGSPELREVLVHIQDELKTPGSIYPQRVAVEGRRMVEYVVHTLAANLGAPWKGSMLEDIEALRKTDLVAPWIISYLHSLRVFGNEGVHFKGDVPYTPRKLQPGDLTAILCSISRVLNYWQELPRKQ